MYVEAIIFSNFVTLKAAIYERFIYEIEWCERLRIVYPNRVSGRFFDVTNGHAIRKLGDTIKIDSAVCP
ncbi:MAG: hypothetical protein EA411_04435 [Saprospirales bacterium]|nr:MAG: hypothetical protein EA411_04435 [Saprospirales bacterium]